MICRPFLYLSGSFLLVALASPLQGQGEIDLELLAGMKAGSIGPAGTGGS